MARILFGPWDVTTSQAKKNSNSPDGCELKFCKNFFVPLLESNVDNKLFRGSQKKARSTRAMVLISSGGGHHGDMNRLCFTNEWLRKS